MEANILPSPSFPFTRKPSSIKTHNLRFKALSATSNKSNGTKEAAKEEAKEEEEGEEEGEMVPRQAINTLNIRYRARSKRQARQQQQQRMEAKPSPPKKEWEDMTLAEKAIELYVGEKGLLFWLNKFAYASIFIIIGGWIVFRFVGPSLGLYQLDAPPLSPTSILKGSP